jgi:hypothetical protein
MSYILATLLFIWLIFYLLKEFGTKNILTKPKIHVPFRRDIQIKDDPFKGGLPVKKIYFFSNNRLLNEPHIFYYFNMLRLQDCKEITDETIDDAAFKRYALINKVAYNKNWPIASRDIYAAKAYLIDRWAYMAHLN